MTIAARRLLMIVFIVIFFFLATAIIFISAGYAYSFQERRIYRPGLVVLESNPQPESLFVDGEQRTFSGNPIRISKLEPGNHVVRLERSGFFPWEAPVTVAGGEATTITNILLFRQSAATELATDIAYIQATSPTTAHYVSGSPQQLFSLDLERSTITNIPFTFTGVVQEILTSSHSSVLAIRQAEDERQTLTFLHPNGAPAGQTVIVNTQDKIRWSTSSGDTLMILSDDGVLRSLAIATGSTTIIAAQVQSWDEEGDTLRILTRSKDLLLRQPGKDPFLVTTFSDISSSATLDASPDGYLTLRDPEKRNVRVFRIDNSDVQQLASLRAESALWHQDGQRLLYGTTHDVSVVNLKTGDDTLLNRSSAAFQLPTWIAGTNFVTFLHENELQIVDASAIARPILLATPEKALLFLFTYKNKKMFMFDGQSLTSFELVD